MTVLPPSSSESPSWPTTKSALSRFRQAVSAGVMAGLLAVAFTTALSGGRDPNYALQPHRDEPTEVAAGVDCEQLNLVHELRAQTERSAKDGQFRRDSARARRILDCDA